MKAVGVDVVFLPGELGDRHTTGRAVVVFDVLRATTSMTAALAAGVEEIHVFPDIEAAARAAREQPDRPLLCGEVKCLPPPGFDLGNSPEAFRRDLHGQRVAYLATTNGTRAVIAARSAEHLLVGAVVNASAVARELVRLGRDVTLLCAGTGGEMAMEDVLGAGAVLDALVERNAGEPVSDAARMALRLFRAARSNLGEVMAEATGGRNLIAVQLERDIDFCARLDALDVVGVVRGGDPLRVTLAR